MRPVFSSVSIGAHLWPNQSRLDHTNFKEVFDPNSIPFSNRVSKQPFDAITRA